MFDLATLSGVLVAVASPLQRDGAVDEPATARLVEHVIAGGVHGVLALGSTGETASLDEASRRKVLGAVVKAADRRVPVLCGVAQPQLSSAIAEVEAAAQLGAEAALVAPPFYYPMAQAQLLELVRSGRGAVLLSAIEPRLEMVDVSDADLAPSVNGLQPDREAQLRQHHSHLVLLAPQTSKQCDLRHHRG